MQQGRGAAALDMRSQRLNLLARRGVAVVKKIPARFWRTLAAFLLVLWLAHSLGRLFWLVAPEPQVPEARVAANALVSDRSTADTRRVDVDALKELQVFGRVDQTLAADELQQEEIARGPSIEDEAVDTQLRLRLQGIVDSSDETSGRAIIASGSQQAIYSPGDQLPEGRNVTLEKILPLRVILNNDGRYESLWLYQEGEFSARRSTNRRQEPVADRPSRSWEGDEDELTDAPAEVEPDSAQAGDPQPPADAEEVVGEVSRALSDVVSMSIHREGGQIVGYRIRPGRDSATFESLGLQAGDVVRAVNGVELSSPQRIMELYRDMGDATSASLLIDRDGQEISVDIDLE